VLEPQANLIPAAELRGETRPLGDAGPGMADQGGAALIVKMRNGDREASAEFMARFGSRLLRRIRSKLSQPMRRVFDSLDILSTLTRRLDLFVRDGRLEAINEAQMWCLLVKMAEHAIVDKARIFRRLQAVEAEDSPFAQRMLQRLQAADQQYPGGAEAEVERALFSLDDPIDRTILSLWLTGTPHATTAQWVGLSPAAVRQRWQCIRARLRGVVEAE
jgi:DNA-directed RNA polymerase specialized sigma24 family protein